MSAASVSGRLRAQREVEANRADPDYAAKRRTALAAKRQSQPKSPKPLHRQYAAAWRAAGKPKDFPSMAEWLASLPEA